MTILGAKNEPDPAPIQPRPVARSTQIFMEKLEAAKEVMAMINQEQMRNLDMARQFAELAKSVGWPQPP